MPDNQDHDHQPLLEGNRKLKLVGENENDISRHHDHTSESVFPGLNQSNTDAGRSTPGQGICAAEPESPNTKNSDPVEIQRPLDTQVRNASRSNDDKDSDTRGSLAARLLMVAGIILLSFALWSGWQDLNREIKPAQVQQPQLTPAHYTSDQPAQLKTLEIKKVRPGMRVEAFNPEVTDEERAGWQDINHKRWFELSVLLIGNDGGPIYLDLIRPVEWVLELDAQEGNRIWLELPELNSEGWGKVTRLRRCRPFEEGPGRIVTGTFSRQVRDVINVHVDGLKDPHRNYREPSVLERGQASVRCSRKPATRRTLAFNGWWFQRWYRPGNGNHPPWPSRPPRDGLQPGSRRRARLPSQRAWVGGA